MDSFAHLDFASRQVVKAWIRSERPRPIPWTPLEKPVSDCRIALVSSGALAMADDEPFDQQRERDDPWWGDPSFRVIPQSARTGDVIGYHLHVPDMASQDLDVVLPTGVLQTLADEGRIGAPTDRHLSFQGYHLEPEAELLSRSVPKMIEVLRDERADIIVLAPS